MIPVYLGKGGDGEKREGEKKTAVLVLWAKWTTLAKAFFARTSFSDFASMKNQDRIFWFVFHSLSDIR